MIEDLYVAVGPLLRDNETVGLSGYIKCLSAHGSLARSDLRIAPKTITSYDIRLSWKQSWQLLIYQLAYCACLPLSSGVTAVRHGEATVSCLLQRLRSLVDG